MRTWVEMILFASLAMAVLGCNGGGGGTPDGGTGPCDYPEASGTLALGETMPAFRWNGVVGLDGLPTDFDLHAFYCDDAYSGYDSLVLIVGAGWCSACPEYIQPVNMMAPQLQASRSLLAYLEVETADFEPATSADADEYLTALIADGWGMRMGDADNTEPGAVRSKVSQMPSAYFVRRRDMEIVADQSASIYTIDFGALAADPEGGWTPVLPPFEAHCGPADEEPLEPNDMLESAPVLAPGEIMGGICTDAPDFYRVDIAGPWRFDLYLDNFAGDLNLRLYDDSLERIGGSTQRANHDWIEWMGPGYVEVYGEDRASNVYRVTLTAR